MAPVNTRRMSAAAVGAAVVLALAGCASDDSTTAATTDSTTAMATSVSATPAPPAFGTVGGATLGMSESEVESAVGSLGTASKADGCITYTPNGSDGVSYGFSASAKTLSIISMPSGGPGIPATSTIGELRTMFPGSTVEYHGPFGPNPAAVSVSPATGDAALVYENADGESDGSTVSRPAFGPKGWNGKAGCPAV
ncbi:hypothetical protein nbrc107696_26820 [Gordonia spumicola]|uniref:Lipoprotein n=1 Tax=Gordonia spumicola TaxID=589161 RepID=A0A7I9VA14_9ACTN|nr:hypothetical protein nbrc107696_26820 [Gordonia spumicola]